MGRSAGESVNKGPIPRTRGALRARLRGATNAPPIKVIRKAASLTRLLCSCGIPLLLFFTLVPPVLVFDF